MRDRAWFVRLYGEIIIDRTAAQTMLYLTCTTITSVDLAHYGVSHAKTGYLWIVVQYQFTCLCCRLSLLSITIICANKVAVDRDFPTAVSAWLTAIYNSMLSSLVMLNMNKFSADSHYVRPQHKVRKLILPFMLPPPPPPTHTHTAPHNPGQFLLFY